MARALLLVVLGLVALAAATYKPVKWTNLHVKWSIFSYLSHLSGDAYFKLPLSVKEAFQSGWVEATSDDITSTWCMEDDPRICTLYDLQGSIAALQVSIPAKDMLFEGNPYNNDIPNRFIRNRIFNTDVFSVRYFFVDKATLREGGRVQPVELGSGLWLESGDGLLEVPRNAEELPSHNWTRAGCVLEMGRHYYHKLNKQMPCREAGPFFLLTDHRREALHGAGYFAFGKFSTKDRKWFEYVPASGIKPTISEAPKCLEEWGAKYGFVTLHIYFVERPWFIMC